MFLIAELSNGYGLFVPLMLVASLSFAISLLPRTRFDIHQEAAGHGKQPSRTTGPGGDGLPRPRQADRRRNFSPVSKEATLGDLVHIISSSKRNVFPVIKEGGEFAGIILLDDIRTDMFDCAKYRTPCLQVCRTAPPDIIFKNR